MKLFTGKISLSVILAVVLILTCTSCGGEKPEPSQAPASSEPSSEPAAEPITVTGDVVAAVLPAGWSLVSGTDMNGASGSDYICHAEKFELGDSYLQTTRDGRSIDDVSAVLKAKGVEPLPPDAAPFRRFSPCPPWWASARLRRPQQKSLENCSPSGAKQF